MIVGKIKSDILIFPLTINKKLYSCLPLISLTGNDSKIIDLLNKSFSKILYKLKSNDLLKILNGNFRIMTKFVSNEKQNAQFIDTLIKEIEKRSGVLDLKLRDLNTFLNILVSDKFPFLNKDIFVEAIVQKQINNYMKIIRFRLKKNEPEKTNLHFFGDFLASLQKINYCNEAIINFFTNIKDLNPTLVGNHFVSLVIFLSAQEKNKEEISELITHFCRVASKTSLHIFRFEELPLFLKSLAKIETPDNKIIQDIMKKSFGFFCNSLSKFSDVNICRFIESFKIFSKGSKLPLLELLIKSINRFIFKNEYYSLEEIEEITKLRDMTLEEKSNFPRISSYVFLKDSYNDQYKFLIRRHTQIINAFWVCCNLFLKNSISYELKPSIIWKEFAFCLNNVAVAELLTIDNIQKLQDIKNLIEINNFPETENFFKNQMFKETFKKQEEFILNNFPERNKKLRNILMKKLELEITKSDIKSDIKLEECKIIKNAFPVDICLYNMRNNQKVGIIVSHIYEERNEQINNEESIFQEYFRIKTNTIQYHFDGQIYFITQENQMDSLKIQEILKKLRHNN